MFRRVTGGCDGDAEFSSQRATRDRRTVVPDWSTPRRGLDTLRSHAFRTVTGGNLQRGAIVSDDFEPTTEYPPTNWERDTEFEAPGPLSRPLANYLAMCAPRSARVSRANRFRGHSDLVLAGAASVN
jgi:hypothetical protein